MYIHIKMAVDRRRAYYRHQQVAPAGEDSDGNDTARRGSLGNEFDIMDMDKAKGAVASLSPTGSERDGAEDLASNDSSLDPERIRQRDQM